MRLELQRGYTLLEVLVATSIFSLLAAAGLGLMATSHQLHHRGLSMSETQHDARMSLLRLSREVRMAGYDPSGVLPSLSSPTAIQLADSDEVRFVADVTGDATLNQVRIHLQGSNLVREVTTWDGSAFSSPNSGVLTDAVDLLTLRYFDATTPTNVEFTPPVTGTNLAAIRRLTMSVTVSDTTIGAATSFPLIVDIKLRN